MAIFYIKEVDIHIAFMKKIIGRTFFKMCVKSLFLQKKYKICRYWHCDLLDNLALTWHQRTEGPIHSENVFKIKLVVWDFWVLSSKVTKCYMGFLYKSQRKCFPWFCLLFSICTCGLDCIPPPPPQKIIFNQNQFLCTLLWKKHK